jgi:hypothetical protein
MCIRIVSNQMPTLAMLATSCLDSSTRCSAVSPAHSGVPYSDTRCAGSYSAPGTGGAVQSISMSGS